MMGIALIWCVPSAKNKGRAKLGAIGMSFSSLELVANCGVIVGVVSFKFIVSFFKFVSVFFEYVGELSSSTSFLIIELANTRTSNSLL